MREVELMEYNEGWEVAFKREREQIMCALGEKVIAIEHIGSTAIHNLKAKPIIDILIGINQLTDVPECVNSLEEAGFRYVPKPELTDRAFFRKGRWGRGTVHIHVCTYESCEWMNQLLFRDYLRLHREVACEYETLKVKLAEAYSFDRATYTKEKAPFIQGILKRARQEFNYNQ